MEFRPKLQDAVTTNSSSGSLSSAAGGGSAAPTPACKPASPVFGQPPSPAASQAVPFPTTFVQADTSSFKQVVQILTGSAETAAAAATPPMEFRPKLQDAVTTNSSSGSLSSAAGGGSAAPTPSCKPASPVFGQPPSPAASQTVPFPTTFIQADTSSFKQVVQILTGSAETAAAAATAAAGPTSQKSLIPPAAKATGPKKPAFKLYERRNTLKNMQTINPLLPNLLDSSPNSPVAAAPAAFFSLQLPEPLSPSTLNFPSLSLGPVTPLISDPFERSPPPWGSDAAKRAEDREIAEKGFYLHPSPRSGRGGNEPPQLLPLFPVMPPKAAAEYYSATCNWNS